jgi:hypothetical protein
MGDNFQIAHFKTNQIASCHIASLLGDPRQEAPAAADVPVPPRGSVLVVDAVTTFFLRVGEFGAAERRGFGICLRLTQCSEGAVNRPASAFAAPNPSGDILGRPGLVRDLPELKFEHHCSLLWLRDERRSFVLRDTRTRPAKLALDEVNLTRGARAAGGLLQRAEFLRIGVFRLEGGMDRGGKRAFGVGKPLSGPGRCERLLETRSQ